MRVHRPDIGSAATLILAFVCLAVVSHAQVSKSKVDLAEPSGCEHFKNALDYSILETNREEDAYLMLIFSPGRKEAAESLFTSRREFITRYIKAKDPRFDKLVTARGDRTSNLGRLDIYVKGKRRWTLFFRQGKRGWDSCVE